MSMLFNEDSRVKISSMNFFTKKEFELLDRYKGKTCDRTIPEFANVYNVLSNAYTKVEEWANLIKDSLVKDGVIRIRKKPTSQASKFDGYLWAKIYPTKTDLDDKWLAITVGLDDDFHFDLKIDTVGLKNHQDLRKSYEKYRGDFYNSEIVIRYSFDEIADWDELIRKSTEAIIKLTKLYPEVKALKSDIETKISMDTLDEKEAFNTKTPVNQILYGPPGTGKTYSLQKDFFPKYTSKETLITKDHFFRSIISECSWWQVIAIALLDLKKAKVADIKNHLWVKQKTELSTTESVSPILWAQLQSHTIEDCEYVKVRSRQSPAIFSKTKDSYWEILEEEVKEQVPELFDYIDKVKNFDPDPDKIIKRYEFTTFHQSFSYEDFIEGIKPVMISDKDIASELQYRIEDGVFKKLCNDARKDLNNRYAIFIDEINRGNVSQIFGELITLIEPDKREGQPNEMFVQLPYSKKEFSVPPNLDIYGTMNTADRSVEALDTALRRRFSFVEMMPRPELLSPSAMYCRLLWKYEKVDWEDTEYKNKEKELFDFFGGELHEKRKGIWKNMKKEKNPSELSYFDGYKFTEINLQSILETINQRIETLIDRDHIIGHSYFMDIHSLEELTFVFKDKVIPLLQEYFYGDYGKIGLVLGKGFVGYIKPKEDLFPTFEYQGRDQLNEGYYKLIPIDENFKIKEAIDTLLNVKNKATNKN
ncbi:McrB family protein [Aquimarina muelleri]|uniref:ATPase dynein-related AAA domain-containing protein n=1 Tax=Aquimarina muelleri TaxID=279356 RepID=A0A918JSW1_9FLAO|nr:AAA family ATPase [Aquimarina muelleri]MCX2762035.1 AAA family ATPase [Aquimarina muelleri]GGX03976.1 hypothetical protein GCM10007384_02180 [Aquimarina muelleri]